MKSRQTILLLYLPIIINVKLELITLQFGFVFRINNTSTFVVLFWQTFVKFS